MIILPWVLLPTVLAGYAISQFVIAQTSAVGADVGKIGAAINLLMGLLGVLGVLGFLVGLPVGIYLVTRKETEWFDALKRKPRFHGMSDESLRFVTGWSWAAFFCTPVWALGNKLWFWFLGSLVPFWNVYVWLKLSVDGRQIAWERSSEHIGAFRKRQKIIAWVVLALFVLGIVSSVMDAVNGPSKTGVSSAAREIACDAYDDTDGDGLPDGQEKNDLGTDPAKADSDADGYSDYDELVGGYDPNGTTFMDDADGDGLADGREREFYGSDEKKTDSDGDGVSDLDEVRAGSDPDGSGDMERVLRRYQLRNSILRQNCGDT